MKKIALNKVINLILFFYILSIYIFTYQENLNMISNFLALLLVVVIWSNFLLSEKNFYFNRFLLIHLLFILITMISSFYAINQSVSLSKVMTLILIYIIMLSLVNYINTFDKLIKLLSYFVYSGFFTSIYIILISDFQMINRFGGEIGNVNAIGMIIGISSIFAFYFILEYKKKIIWIIMLLTNLFVVLLTGSRKSLILILLTFLIILLTRNRHGIKGRISTLFLGSIIIIGSIYLIFNVPIFYEIIGHRVEDLIAFITIGGENKDESINVRVDLIGQGLEWFKERPFIGYGINNFRFLYGRTVGGLYTYSHNNFIELLIGVGLIGTFTFYFAHLTVIKDLYKTSKNRNSRIYTLCISFISMISVYMLLSTGLVYYDSKHFSIVIVIGSIISRIISLEFEKTSKDLI